MTIIFADGFDHYATADGLKKWDTFGTGVSINASGGRRGGGALAFSGSTRFAEKLIVPSNLGYYPSPYRTIAVGFALSPGANNVDICYLRNDLTAHVGLLLTSNYAISAWRGSNSTVLGTSANNVVASSGYTYIVFKAYIHDTAGTIDVWVNGAATPVLSLTGQDTRNGGNGPGINLLGIRGVGASTYDDLVVTDGTNLGDVRIDTLYPNADGNYSQFTPSTGGTHYVLVDEAPVNTSDYNTSTATLNDRDSYAMSNLGTLVSSTIHGVQVVTASLKTADTGSRGLAPFIRSGSTNGDGTGRLLTASQSFQYQVAETDPNTSGAWSLSAINAMEVGAVVKAG